MKTKSVFDDGSDFGTCVGGFTINSGDNNSHLSGDGATKGFQLSDTQRLDWLQLIRSENVGPATFRDLINHFGTGAKALDALPELSNRAGKKFIKICPRHRAEAELEKAALLNIKYVGMGETAYPRYLKSIDYPPPLLSMRGELEVNKHPPIAMVGARNCSLSGLKLAKIFAIGLGKAQYHIVSGFARGIDSAAHSAAMDTGSVGVLAGGVDVIFPPENDEFYRQMLDSGNCFVSEMPLGYRPRAIDFPRRNRIIAGISLAVVVIEAAKRSGSLITARLANEAGRLVFAVPGSPLDPRSAGANTLLKNGALIAAEPGDIISEIAPLLEKHETGDLFTQSGNSLEDDDEMSGMDDEILTDTNPSHREKILQALGPTPIEVDELVRHCKLPVSHVQLVLIELSLAGRLERHAGNMVSLVMGE